MLTGDPYAVSLYFECNVHLFELRSESRNIRSVSVKTVVPTASPYALE